jgi:hypothetical protein
MGGNPLDHHRSKAPLLPQYNLAKRKKKRIRSKMTDPVAGFGPWIADQEKSFNQTFIDSTGIVPRIKIDLNSS